MLKAAIAITGPRSWKQIAASVPGRSHAQCLQRWSKVLRPGLVKGPWTKIEDESLVRHVVEFGWTSWTDIATEVKGRTSKQCRERWFHHLDPAIKRSPYTSDEDSLILEQHAQFGGRWAQIACLLPGRTDDAVKIRCNTLLRLQRHGGSTSSKRIPKVGTHTTPRQVQKTKHESFSPFGPGDSVQAVPSFKRRRVIPQVQQQREPLPHPTQVPSHETVRRKMQCKLGRGLTAEEESRISVLLAQVNKRLQQHQHDHQQQHQPVVAVAVDMNRGASKDPPDSVDDFSEIGLLCMSQNIDFAEELIVPQKPCQNLLQMQSQSQQPRHHELKADLEQFLEELADLPEMSAQADALSDLDIDVDIEIDIEIDALGECSTFSTFDKCTKCTTLAV